MACRTLYTTSTSTVLSTQTQTSLITVTSPAATSFVTSTATVSSCVPCVTLGPFTACVPLCTTSTSVQVQSTVVPGDTSISTETVRSVATSLATSVIATETSCPATPTTPTAAAATTTTRSTTPVPTAATTTTPVQAAVPTAPTLAQAANSAAALSTSLSVVVLTTTLGNGQVAISSSLTPVLVPTGDASSSGSSSGSSTPTGAIVGATLGGIAAVVLLVLLLWGCMKRRGPFACLSSMRDSDDGLDEAYWAPVAASAAKDEDDDERHDLGGGGRASSVRSHERDDMVESHSGHGGPGVMTANGFRRSESTFSYVTDPSRSHSPPLIYPSRPNSMHSSPSYYSTYPVVTCAPPQTVPYPAPYPAAASMGDVPADLIRRASSPTSPPPLIATSSPYYAPGLPQRSRSIVLPRTASYLSGARLQHWDESDESAPHASHAPDTTGTSSQQDREYPTFAGHSASPVAEHTDHWSGPRPR